MNRVKITALRQTVYADLSGQLEQPMPPSEACPVKTGSVFFSKGEQPDGLCDSAWETLRPFVEKLAAGEGQFFGNWMKNPYSALISCNDGFRPMSFLLEAENGPTEEPDRRTGEN